MEKSFSSKPKVHACTIAGLAFFPKKIDALTFTSMHAWLEAGKPDGARVFDNVDTLKVCGVPICDALAVQGMYRRCVPRKPQPAKVVLVMHLIKPLRLGEVKSKTEGIKVAEPKDHNKMVY